MKGNQTPPRARETLLATCEVAELLGMSREQVWRMFNSGRLPAYRFDRLLRFAPGDVEAFMAKHYHGTGAERPTRAKPDDQMPLPPTTTYRPI